LADFLTLILKNSEKSSDGRQVMAKAHIAFGKVS
jgi:hypothetical protein